MAETRMIQKQLAGVEDLLTGIGEATQVRATGNKTITKINVDQLQGALVVDTIEEMNALDINKLVTKVCFVKGYGTYHYNDSNWVLNGPIVVDTIEEMNALDITKLVTKVCFVKGYGTYHYSGSNWVLNGPIVVDTIEEMNALDITKLVTKVCFVKGYGTYHYSGSNWVLNDNSTHNATPKENPADADELGIVDSSSSFSLKKLRWSNLKASLKTYFFNTSNVLIGTTTDNVVDKLQVNGKISASNIKTFGYFIVHDGTSKPLHTFNAGNYDQVSYEITIKTADFNYPNGALLQKVYVAFYTGNGVINGTPSILVEDKIKSTSIEVTFPTYSLSIVGFSVQLNVTYTSGQAYHYLTML